MPRTCPEEVGEVVELARLVEPGECVRLFEVLHDPGDALGAHACERIVDARNDDVAQLVEHGGVEPVVVSGGGVGSRFGRCQLEADCRRQRLEPQAPVQHAVDHLVADVGATSFRHRGMGPGSGPTVRHHLQLRFGHDLVVADARFVDRVPRPRRVLAQAGREVGQRFLRGAEGQPGDVVHGIAEMRELPVDDGHDATMFEHEVPGPGIALDQHHRAVVRGDVPPQPVEREREGRVGRAAALLQHIVELVELGDDRGRSRRRRGNAGRSSSAGSSRWSSDRCAMKSSRGRDPFLRIGDPGEPVLAGESLREHRLMRTVYAEYAGHRHRGTLQGEIDGRLTVQRPRVDVRGRVGSVVAQEQLVDVPVGPGDVDEPGFLAGAARASTGVTHATVGDALDPRDEVGGQRDAARHRAQPAAVVPRRPIALSSRYSSKPSLPFSRPMPLCLYPPNGTSGWNHEPPFTQSVPVRMRRATAIARSSLALSTIPERPYCELFAIRTASSSSSYGMTARTGPKISSCAIVASGSTSTNNVGSTK